MKTTERQGTSVRLKYASLGVAVTSRFTDVIAQIAQSNLPDSEKYARHQLVANLMTDINEIIKEHQEDVSEVKSELFELANILGRLSS